MTSAAPARQSLATRVAEATGLAGMLADGAVRRCCKRADIDVECLAPRDIERLLPHLDAILRLYLTPPELAVALDRLARLAEGAERTGRFRR